MHRMRPLESPQRHRGRGRRRVAHSLALALLVGVASRAEADLLRPSPTQAYPDLSADINGTVNYTFDPSSQTGRFQATNTPFLLSGGPNAAVEFGVLPTADGTRQQFVRLQLDPAGNLVSSPDNTYELYGTVVAGGQTYSGLLLKGTPTAFGWQYHPPSGTQGSALFDLNIKLTGGYLASAFGPDAYMDLDPQLLSTFDGTFHRDFSAAKVVSNTRAYHAPLPFPAPEPTALALLVGGGLVLAVRLRRVGRSGVGRSGVGSRQ